MFIKKMNGINLKMFLENLKKFIKSWKNKIYIGLSNETPWGVIKLS